MESNSHDSGAGTQPEPLGIDFIIPVLGSSLTAYYLLTTTDLVWEARVTATFIGVILLSLSAVQFARLLARIAAGRGGFGLGELVTNNLFNRQRLGLLVLAALFIATIDWTGTTLGLILVLIGCMLMLGVRKISTLLAISLTTGAVVYGLLIYLLESHLPKGPIEQLLGQLLGIGA